MSFGAAVLLGLALSAPPASAPPPPRATQPSGAPVARASRQPPPLVCTSYRVLVEQNELAPEAEVAGWATAALGRAALLDPASPCFVHVRITAGPTRTGGREDGFVAHVAASTRRFFRDGKLVTREKGMLFIEPRREGVVARARTFVEEFVAGLK